MMMTLTFGVAGFITRGNFGECLSLGARDVNLNMRTFYHQGVQCRIRTLPSALLCVFTDDDGR